MAATARRIGVDRSRMVGGSVEPPAGGGAAELAPDAAPHRSAEGPVDEGPRVYAKTRHVWIRKLPDLPQAMFGHSASPLEASLPTPPSTGTQPKSLTYWLTEK